MLLRAHTLATLQRTLRELLVVLRRDVRRMQWLMCEVDAMAYVVCRVAGSRPPLKKSPKKQVV